MSRRKITRRLTRAASYYFISKNFSTHKEVALGNWNSKRADLFAFNMKRDLVMVEVKSCWQDYTSDTKWHSYLPFADKMYFCISQELWEKKGDVIANDVKQHGVGIMILTNSGHITIVQNAKKLGNATTEFKDWLMLKLAWRGGARSRANVPRKKYKGPVFLSKKK